jgi:hypothetical protein
MWYGMILFALLMILSSRISFRKLVPYNILACLYLMHVNTNNEHILKQCSDSLIRCYANILPAI